MVDVVQVAEMLRSELANAIGRDGLWRAVLCDGKLGCVTIDG
jgi:hypothetical protein